VEVDAEQRHNGVHQLNPAQHLITIRIIVLFMT
jgi:hypothetical protein